MYRHIAWLYTLRSQLLVSTPWEHISLKQSTRIVNAKRIKRWKSGLHEDITKEMLFQHLENEELNKVMDYKNPATQLIDN